MATVVNIAEREIRNLKDRTTRLEVEGEIAKITGEAMCSELKEHEKMLDFLARAVIVFGICELILFTLLAVIIHNM